MEPLLLPNPARHPFQPCPKKPVLSTFNKAEQCPGAVNASQRQSDRTALFQGRRRLTERSHCGYRAWWLIHREDVQERGAGILPAEEDSLKFHISDWTCAPETQDFHCDSFFGELIFPVVSYLFSLHRSTIFLKHKCFTLQNIHCAAYNNTYEGAHLLCPCETS